MKLGLAAWGLRRTPLEEQLAMTKRLNLDLLELGIAGNPNDFLQADSTRREIKTVETMFHAAGVKFLCGATGNDFLLPDETDCLRSLEQTRRAIGIAGSLGIRYLRIFAGFAPLESTEGKRREILLKCLSQAYKTAADENVIPVVETHGCAEHLKDGSVRCFPSVTTDPEALESLLEEIPAMRLNFDPANLFVLGMDVCAFYRRFKDKIVYSHLKDFVPFRSGWKPAACGESRMDWEALLGEMKSFEGPALLEYEIPEDVEDGFRRSLKRISDRREIS